MIFALTLASQIGFAQGKIWRTIHFDKYPNRAYLLAYHDLPSLIYDGINAKEITPYEYNEGFARFSQSYFDRVDGYQIINNSLQQDRRSGGKLFPALEIQEYYWKDRQDKQKYDIQAIVLVGKKRSGGTIKILCKYSEVKKFLLERYQTYKKRLSPKYICFEELKDFWQSPDDPLLQTSYAQALEDRQFNSEITRTEGIDRKLLRTIKRESNAYPRKQRNINTQLKPCFIKTGDGSIRTTLYYSLDLWDKRYNYLHQVISVILKKTKEFRIQAYKYEKVYLFPNDPIHPEALPRKYEMSKSKIQLVYWQNVDPTTGKKQWEAIRIDLFNFNAKRPIISYKFRDLKDVRRFSGKEVKVMLDFITKIATKPPQKAILERFSNPERLTIRQIWRQRVKPVRYPNKYHPKKLEKLYQKALRKLEADLAN